MHLISKIEERLTVSLLLLMSKLRKPMTYVKPNKFISSIKRADTLEIHSHQDIREEVKKYSYKLYSNITDYTKYITNNHSPYFTYYN